MQRISRNIIMVDGAQKTLKMYDSLMKSGKFTAAQNKEENGEFIDSLSELFLICEKDGFIPRYYVDSPKDKVDRVLEDLQNYTKTLVTEEMNLGALIENSFKQIEIDKANENRIDDYDDDLDVNSENYDDELEKQLYENDGKELLRDEDFMEFFEFEEELELGDENL